MTAAVEIAAIVERMQAAGHALESVLDAHALEPPDAGFPGRLRALSSAAVEQAKAFELPTKGGLGWRSRTIDGDFALAPELTPGMNWGSPGFIAFWPLALGRLRNRGNPIVLSSLGWLHVQQTGLSPIRNAVSPVLRSLAALVGCVTWPRRHDSQQGKSGGRR